MTVYFVHRVGDDSQIKIGFTTTLADRLRRLASEYGDVRMFAQCDGGAETERLYHLAFVHLRVEGEWFKSEPGLLSFIKENAQPVDLIVPRRVSEWRRRAAENDKRDALTAAAIMRTYFDRFPATMKMCDARELLYAELVSLNPVWSRRRVRALWEGDARRVDLFEVVDILTVTGLPKEEWGNAIAFKDARSAFEADAAEAAAHRQTMAGTSRQMGL